MSAQLQSVPFFGAYISCPSQDTTPRREEEDKGTGKHRERERDRQRERQREEEVSGWLQSDDGDDGTAFGKVGGRGDDTKIQRKGREKLRRDGWKEGSEWLN